MILDSSNSIISIHKYGTWVSVVVQSSRRIWHFLTPWTAARQASLSLNISWGWPTFMFIASVVPSSHLILCCPLLLLPSIFSSIRDYVCNRWPKYWSFSFTISPSSEYSGLISLKIDWLDLPAVQGTFRSLLQDHSLTQTLENNTDIPLSS